jgi:tetratricopeptide (TPR) repeat protein
MRRLAVPFVAAALSVMGAAAAAADDVLTCRTQGDNSIAACTRLIASGRYRGRELAAIYALRAVYWYKKEDLDRAIVDYGDSIRHDPTIALVYFGRGAALKQRGDVDRAMADFNETIRRDPKIAFAYNVRGLALNAKGELDRAIADFSEAIRLEPGNVNGYFNRGSVYSNKGDRDRAVADFNEVIRLDPQNAAAREKLAALSAPQRPPAPASPPPAKQAVGAGPTTDRRVALVIGNSAYAAFPRIPNPRNDAEDLAASLRTLGFDVLTGLDLNRAKMEELLIAFARKARQSDTALVFYAGHGLQHNGINYLAPTDAKIDDETDLRKLVNLQDVMNDLQSASRVRILIVDACRDNEAIKQLAGRLPATRSAAFTRGLARVEAADGTLVTFATQPNRVAADGQGRNSPFTQALLKHLATPGLELRTLMTRVRSDVVTATGGAQRPEVWDSLVGEFAFQASQ